MFWNLFRQGHRYRVQDGLWPNHKNNNILTFWPQRPAGSHGINFHYWCLRWEDLDCKDSDAYFQHALLVQKFIRMHSLSRSFLQKKTTKKGHFLLHPLAVHCAVNIMCCVWLCRNFSLLVQHKHNFYPAGPVEEGFRNYMLISPGYNCILVYPSYNCILEFTSYNYLLI